MVDWCRSKVSHLIEKLRQHPILWDVRCTDEKNKTLKAEALKEIATSLHVPVEEVRKKLHSLKVQFSREYCRVRRERLRTGRQYIPKWYGYEQLLFLRGANTRHRKLTKVEENDDCNDYTNSDDLSIISINSIKDEYPVPIEDEPEDDKDQIEAQRSSVFPGSHLEVNLDHLNNLNSLQAHLFSQKLATTQNGFYDEFVSYGLYIASKLRSLNDPYLQAVAKYHIGKVIFSVEMKQLQQNLMVKPSTSLENNFPNHMESHSPR